MSDIYLFKVTSPQKVEGERNRPYRTIAIEGSQDLYTLALAINDAFDFDFDHAFGFYNHPKNWGKATKCYELFNDDNGEPFNFFSGEDEEDDDDEYDDDDSDFEGEEEVHIQLSRAMQKIDIAKIEEEVRIEAVDLLNRKIIEALLPHVDDPYKEAAKQLIIESNQQALLPPPPEQEINPFSNIFNPYNDDDSEEYGVKGVKVADVFQKPKEQWIFLFDYGDEWKFELKFLGTQPAEKGKDYPLVVESKGTAPQQYPDWDEE